MDGPVFDAMLKTALEEALRLDAEEMREKTPQLSSQHRRRMRRMLENPWSYLHSGMEGQTRRRHPVRYLAIFAAVIVLTGTAAGYALRGGSFRDMFDASPWAEVYGGAADTGQLLDMGGELDTVFVESGGLRFEMLDAVSDGQVAMVSVRLTVLEKRNQLRTFARGVNFEEVEIASEDGGEISIYSLSISSWMSEGHEDLKPGQYSLIFTINDLALTEGGKYEIRLKDLMGEKNKPLFPGEWTLAVTLQPAQVLNLRPECTCTLNGAEWRLERLTVSPLALTMEFRYVSGAWDGEWNFLSNISIHLKDGRTINSFTTGACGSDSELSLTLEFQMPVDVPQIESVTVSGEEIPLKM